MFKKTMLLAMAVGALVAFAAPALAQAEPILTSEGKGVEPGEVVTATQDPTKHVVTQLKPVSLGQLTCEVIDLSLKVGENTTTTVTGSGTGTATGCENLKQPVTITTINVSSIDLTANATGNASFTFQYDLGTLTNCEFSGTVNLTYGHKSNTVSLVSGNTLTGSGPIGCPTEGEITGGFVLDNAELS